MAGYDPSTLTALQVLLGGLGNNVQASLPKSKRKEEIQNDPPTSEEEMQQKGDELSAAKTQHLNQRYPMLRQRMWGK